MDSPSIALLNVPPHCPICKQPATARHRHTAEAVAAAHSPPARDRERYGRMLTEIRRLWPAGFVDACVCDDCQLGFAWPMVEGDAAFYELLHERAGYPRERWEFRRARENFIGQRGRVLDVGAGRGDFLASLPATVEKHGVEASATLCDELTKRGVEAHPNLADAASAGPYDVVTMFHVVQYFGDPVEALAACRAMLSPTTIEGGGRLLITVPNAPAGGGSIDVVPSPPHPLTRWTKPAIEKAAAAAGLVIDGFAWIPQRPATLLWSANAKTRERAVADPSSMAGRIDSLKPGRVRTALLVSMATLALPRVLWHARSALTQSQMFVVCRAQ